MLTLKQIFKQVHFCGQNNMDFDAWWETWQNSPEFLEALKKHLESLSVNSIDSINERENVVIGSTIISGGNITIGNNNASINIF